MLPMLPGRLDVKFQSVVLSRTEGLSHEGERMALTITRIPQQHRAGFIKLRSLSSETVTTIGQIVEKLPPTSGVKEMVTALSERLPSLNRDDLAAIINTVYSLYVFRASAGPETPIADLVSSVISAMQTSGNDALTLSEDEKADFQQKLTRLLGSKVLETSSKIAQLKTDHTTLFYDAKIITDIRPIFSDPGDLPVAAIITHTLKIVCHDSGGEHRELYFALNSEDLKTINKVLERAQAKESSLKSLLRSANLPELS